MGRMARMARIRQFKKWWLSAIQVDLERFPVWKYQKNHGGSLFRNPRLDDLRAFYTLPGNEEIVRDKISLHHFLGSFSMPAMLVDTVDG